MSTEAIPDKAFFSWLDEHIQAANEWAGRAADRGYPSEYARAAGRADALREVRAYFGGAS